MLLSTSNRRIALSLWRLVALLLGLWVVSLGASEQAAKSSPVSARAASTYQRGMKALQKGDLATAQAEFEKVIGLTPRSAEGHNSLGWVLLSQRQFESAISQFRTAVQLKPDFPQAHINLANALSQTGDLEGAILQGREALRLAPNDAEAHRTLGRVLSFRHDMDGATRELRRAIDLEPRRPDLHDELGSVLAQQSHSEEALAEFSEARFRVRPSSSRCVASRAKVTGRRSLGTTHRHPTRS